jgi:hypothetical protein
MLDRIRIDPRVCEGRPMIRGLRITVEFDVYQAARYDPGSPPNVRHDSDEASAACPDTPPRWG